MSFGWNSMFQTPVCCHPPGLLYLLVFARHCLNSALKLQLVLQVPSYCRVVLTVFILVVINWFLKRTWNLSWKVSFFFFHDLVEELHQRSQQLSPSVLPPFLEFSRNLGAVVLYLDFSSGHQFGVGVKGVSALNLVKLGIWLGNKKLEEHFFSSS